MGKHLPAPPRLVFDRSGVLGVCSGLSQQEKRPTARRPRVERGDLSSGPGHRVRAAPVEVAAEGWGREVLLPSGSAPKCTELEFGLNVWAVAHRCVLLKMQSVDRSSPFWISSSHLG